MQVVPTLYPFNFLSSTLTWRIRIETSFRSSAIMMRCASIVASLTVMRFLASLVVSGACSVNTTFKHLDALGGNHVICGQR